MPYKHANYFVGLVLLTIIVGFWGSYFVPIAEVPLAFHVHATTATLWVILLMIQHWSIHGRHKHLHRYGGMLSLFLFPLLIVGFVMIINVSAERFVSSDGGSGLWLTPSFGIGMAVAIAAYLSLYYLALRNRRNVRLHAGYMLTTPLILFESPFSRIMLDHMPFLVFTGSEFPQRIIDAIVISIGISIVFAVVLYLRDPRWRFPFLLAAILMIVQAVAMYVGPSSEWLRAGFAVYASVPDWLTLVTGFALGVAVSWAGWRAVPSQGAPSPAAPVAA